MNTALVRSVTRIAAGIISCAVFTSQAQAPAQPSKVKDYQVEAVFLFNFAQFVDWPAQAFPDADTPLVIGILGDDPFGKYLDEIVRGERVNNRPLVIQRYRQLDDIKICHILFVSSSEELQVSDIVTRLKGRNILTVSNIDRFAEQNGVMQFVTHKRKIRLKINLDAAKAADLTISSKLLRPAQIVNFKND